MRIACLEKRINKQWKAHNTIKKAWESGSLHLTADRLMMIKTGPDTSEMLPAEVNLHGLLQQHTEASDELKELKSTFDRMMGAL